MTNLASVLGRLGLDQYHDALVEEGFDTWETLLDIQESDLIALNFRLGHRRKLQREIANYRGTPYDHLIGSPALDNVSEPGRVVEGPSTPTEVRESGTHGGSEAKRKYRRHPKPDENAPSRAPSAYVIFSNKIREEVRGQNMSFTEIAKLVGDRWQNLVPAEKEPYETQATMAKDKHNAELAEYKKTDAYQDYMRYLVEFKAKHGGSTPDGKRPKLKKESSTRSLSTESTNAPEMSMVPSKHVRVESMGTVASTASQSDFGSPIQLAPYPGQSLATRLPLISPVTDTTISLPPLENRQYIALSSQSSVSDESTSLMEYPDPLPTTAQLSLQPGPARMVETPRRSPPSTDFRRISGTTRRPVRVRTPIGVPLPASDSYSKSSASSRSNVNSSEGSLHFGNSTSSMDENWPAPSSDAGYPASSKSTSIPLPAVSLPPLVASERLPDVLQDPSQRVLPLPTTPVVSEGYYGLRSLPRISTMTAPRPQDLAGFGLNARTSAEQKASLDPSESEAADALAGLAYGSHTRKAAGPGGSQHAA